MSTGKVLLGVIAGMAAGATLGLLFAPHKGAKTRKNIIGEGETLANTLLHRVDERFQGLIDTITDKLPKKDLVSADSENQSK